MNRKIVLIIFALIIVGSCFVSCKQGSENINEENCFQDFLTVYDTINLNNATEVRIMNQGNEVFIKDAEEIKKYVDLVNSLNIKQIPSTGEDTGGYQYYIDFYDDIELLRVTTFGVNNLTEINGEKYDVSSVDVMEELIQLIESNYD